MPYTYSLRSIFSAAVACAAFLLCSTQFVAQCTYDIDVPEEWCSEWSGEPVYWSGTASCPDATGFGLYIQIDSSYGPWVTNTEWITADTFEELVVASQDIAHMPYGIRKHSLGVQSHLW